MREELIQYRNFVCVDGRGGCIENLYQRYEVSCGRERKRRKERLGGQQNIKRQDESCCWLFFLRESSSLFFPLTGVGYKKLHSLCLVVSHHLSSHRIQRLSTRKKTLLNSVEHVILTLTKMKVFVAGLLVIWAVLDVTSARIIVRRSVPSSQLERESDSPASEVIVIKDTDSRYPTGPRYGLIPNDNESNVFEMDVNDDGTFNFGGHLPHDFHHVHRSFAEIFAAMQRRMEGRFFSFLFFSIFFLTTLNLLFHKQK